MQEELFPTRFFAGFLQVFFAFGLHNIVKEHEKAAPEGGVSSLGATGCQSETVLFL